MSTSRTLIISSGLVGAISLMLRSVLNFSFTGASFLLPTLNPLFIINGIIFALAASTSLFGSDSPATQHHHDDDTYHYEQDHLHDNDHDDHDRNNRSNNSSNSSFDDQYSNKIHEKEKFPVRSESVGSYGVSSPEVNFPPTAPEKPVGLRRPPTAPVKTFPQAISSDGDENETMEEMWERVKAETQPKKPNTTMSTSSWASPPQSPSPSRARRPTPSLSSLSPSSSRARRPTPSLSSLSPSSSRARPGMKLMERIPSWVKMKKELSMGREELNSRVEAFITKFKDEMKLQRLESVRRYKSFRRRNDEN